MMSVRPDGDGSRSWDMTEGESFSEPGLFPKYCDEKSVPEGVMDKYCVNLISQIELMV
jgi:hypothetical protein